MKASSLLWRMKPSTCQGATNRGKQTSVKFEQWRTPSVQALRGQCFSGKTLVSFMFDHRRFRDTRPASLASRKSERWPSTEHRLHAHIHHRGQTCVVVSFLLRKLPYPAGTRRWLDFNCLQLYNNSKLTIVVMQPRSPDLPL